jgi:GH15 family glucan-1,4-alpha-glucosidase
LAKRIEDYAIIGDLEAAALVGNDGSIDWLCMPRFDSPACFAALLGDEGNGFWRIAPDEVTSVRRWYWEDSLVLETAFACPTGTVSIIDCMPIRAGDRRTRVMRLVRGKSGRVPMKLELGIRFDYGHSIPWIKHDSQGLTALSGANALRLETPIRLTGRDFRTHADFEVSAGDEIPFLLTYHSSIETPEQTQDIADLPAATAAWWRKWIERYPDQGPYREAVVRSLITLKSLTHLPTGGIIAAPTMALPERIGGERNWDYRFCWLRDATFTLYALLISGLSEEASQWRDWLLRVAAGYPAQLQTIYAPAGERLLPEFEIDWLPGYEGSRPVRVGNLASQQLQLDVYGEIMDVFHLSRRSGVEESDGAWAFQRALMDFLESSWDQPDNGIWEVRGGRRHFTHSKVMAWVAVDRAVKAVEKSGLDGPVERWKALRKQIHSEVCSKGFDASRNTFVQAYGSDKLDAALLMIPLVGFLPAKDPRCLGTVRAIEQGLVSDRFVQRYQPDVEVEGVAGEEGAFLPCTFWLADCYALQGRLDDARGLLDRLLKIRNDVGLLSEEYDPKNKRLLGNFPQAFTHVSLVNTVHGLTARSPAVERSEEPGSSG